LVGVVNLDCDNTITLTGMYQINSNTQWLVLSVQSGVVFKDVNGGCVNTGGSSHVYCVAGTFSRNYSVHKGWSAASPVFHWLKVKDSGGITGCCVFG
jgi:hypothetical protein